MSIDRLHLERAVELARRGEGRVEPNPPVGAVVVREGEVVGEGWHHALGRPHAEVEALLAAGDRARGATLYVTLEPCCHHGKTPPCTEAIRAAGLASVVYGVTDPDPRVAGQGVEALREAGISVRRAEDPVAVEGLLAPYFRWKLQGLPWIVAKWAMTLDGRIATRTGHSRWISSAESRDRVHQARDLCSSVWVGSGTALADDPHLTCRLEGGRQPMRVVVDSKVRLPLASKLVETVEEGPVLVAAGEGAPQGKVEALESRGVEVVCLPIREDGWVDLEALAREMVRRDRVKVLVEGGGRLLGSLFDLGLVDEVEVYVAPKLVGGEGAPSPIGGQGVGSIEEAWSLVECRRESVGEDVLFRGRIDRDVVS